MYGTQKSKSKLCLVWFGLYICPYKPKPIFIEAGQKKKWVGCNDGCSLGGHSGWEFRFNGLPQISFRAFGSSNVADWGRRTVKNI